MKAYKAFNKDMTCRGFQYEEGKSYETEVANLCHSGFHACLAPLDCLRYYKVSDSVFHEVELDDVSDERQDDTKICSKKITIGKRLSIIDVVKAQIDFVFETAETGYIPNEYRATSVTNKQWSTAATSGEFSISATSGDKSTAAASGYNATVATYGNESTAATSGFKSVAATSGYDATAAASGGWTTAVTSITESTAATSGNGSISVTFGNRSTAATSGRLTMAETSGAESIAAASGAESIAAAFGDGSIASALGNWASAETSGKNSIAVATGVNSYGKGSIGSYIVLAEYDDYGNMTAKMERVDGDRIKADTWYTLKNGEFVEQQKRRFKPD